MKTKIFNYQDQADPDRMNIVVMVCLEHNGTEPHVHMLQQSLARTPTNYDEYMKKTPHNWGHIVLSASDFPKLTKQIKQAVKDLKAEP